MIKIIKLMFLFFAISLISPPVIGNCNHTTSKQNNTNAPSIEKSLQEFLSIWSNNKTIQYNVAFYDLNHNGKHEAIVYITDRNWCGSGGCSTLILVQRDKSWNILTKISVSRLPIRALTDISHGWHSIGIWVQGGGIQSGYEARLIFNGKTYPTNPTASPAKKSKSILKGKVLIPKKIIKNHVIVKEHKNQI